MILVNIDNIRYHIQEALEELMDVYNQPGTPDASENVADAIDMLSSALNKLEEE